MASLPMFGNEEDVRRALHRINTSVDGGTLSIGSRVDVGLNILASAIVELPPNAAHEIVAVISALLSELAPAPVASDNQLRAA